MATNLQERMEQPPQEPTLVNIIEIRLENKIDRAVADIKEEQRASEGRLREEQKASEARLDSKINDAIAQQRASEARLDKKIDTAVASLKEEQKAIEGRLNTKINSVATDLNTKIEKLDTRIEKLDSKFDALSAKFDSTLKSIKDGNRTNLIAWITAALGILGMLAAIFFG